MTPPSQGAQEPPSLLKDYEIAYVAHALNKAMANDGFTARVIRQLNAAYQPSGAQEPAEECVCAAMCLEDGRIIRGHRHDDCIQTALKWRKAGQSIGSVQAAVQGFITTRNRFVGREEAYQLQAAAGKILPSRRGAHTLTSEDLY